MTGTRQMRTSDVFRARGGEQTPVPINHPEKMPLGLAEQLVKAFSRPDAVVLGPFAGFGTTLVTAEKLGRRAVGIEVVPRYRRLVAERLERVA